MHAEACVPDQQGVPVCGEGKGAMRVFGDTISPSKQYAFAWRSPDGLPSGDATPSDVDNMLIRLSDGAVVAKLGGQYWATGAMRANRYDLVAAWSPDSKAVIEIANSRWDSDSFAYYLLDANAVTKVDLRALVEPALKAKISAKERSNYAFRVPEEKPVSLDISGHVSFTATVYRPKSDEASFDYEVRVDIARKNGKPAARIASMRRVKSD
jgi:hypothetical protein